MTRAPEAGFTLIETLVALAVLAISAMAILGAVEAHLARIGALETRAAAGLAVQNYLAEVSLGLEPAPEALLLGLRFDLQAERLPTADPDLQRLEISATDDQGQVRARLTGFVLAGGAP